ncbi:hypothetical protein BDV34DRAFT_193434 [Aspergillus parasiticus]|uniref:Uncharacterized protein n=1 Tax=Aspergillus parasiticus TaxID=5067 RepID=A0A5N6DQJ3_ASPPA|nr:hypothetical protein BDV34DRAFT_193434 [Aspergillus parasiticus]
MGCRYELVPGQALLFLIKPHRVSTALLMSFSGCGTSLIPRNDCLHQAVVKITLFLSWSAN